jgi:uncharacterized protein YceK
MLKKQMIIGVMLLVLISVVMSGCGTVIYGGHQSLDIKSAPLGVVARVDTQSCVTPCTLVVSRKAEHVYFTGKSGIEREYDLNQRVNFFSTFIGNAVFALIPGLIVDGNSGGNHTIDPVDVELPENLRGN